MTQRKVRITEIECDGCGCTAEYDKHPKSGHAVKPIGWVRLSFSEKVAGERHQITKSFDICPECAKKMRADLERAR